MMKYCFLITIIFLSCNSGKNACDANIKEWIKEAPVALEEFLLIKQEILASQAFIDSTSIQGDLFIYTNKVDSAELEYFRMSLLKEWFRKGRGYISFKENDTSFIYKKCLSNNSMGKIHHGPFNRKQYSSGVTIIDTLKMKDNWFAEVSQCRNCGS